MSHCYLTLARELYDSYQRSWNATRWDGEGSIPSDFGALAHEEEIAWYAVARKAIEITKQ